MAWEAASPLKPAHLGHQHSKRRDVCAQDCQQQQPRAMLEAGRRALCRGADEQARQLLEALGAPACGWVEEQQGSEGALPE